MSTHVTFGLTLESYGELEIVVEADIHPGGVDSVDGIPSIPYGPTVEYTVSGVDQELTKEDRDFIETQYDDVIQTRALETADEMYEAGAPEFDPDDDVWDMPDYEEDF